MAVSPEGETIATGSADETVRFWNVFSKTRSQKVSAKFIQWEK
jgi:cell division cycle 20-like protein 1 (cofactor of APC complex)